jgi:hypothetical protein
MNEVKWREASWETGALEMNPAAIGAFAQQAGGKLGSMASTSRGTASVVLGTAGEGLRDAGMGAGIGASIGSVIPGIGTVIGGAIGAIGGAIVGVVHYLFGGGLGGHAARVLTARERHMLDRGTYINRTRHLPGAFQDAVLYVYNPAAYRLLRAQRRLPSEIEAMLLRKRAYAAHAASIDRQYGARLRRELAHLPPELRTLIGVSTVTGHARELYIALHRALAERARFVDRAARDVREVRLMIPRDLVERARLEHQAALASGAPQAEELEAPALPATPEPASAQESPHDPFRDLPLRDDANDAADQASADVGGVLDDLSIALEQSRRAQRGYLRDSWVKDTWLGDFLRLDQPDDPSAPIAPVAPASAPGSGRPPTITLVPEPDTGALPTTAEEARAQILANPPRLPPASWEPLQAPVHVYFWDPFGGQWTRVGDGDGNDRAKAVVLLMIANSHFPVAYGLLHTSRGNEVIRAVKNASSEPSGDDRLGEWRTIGSGVSRMWSPTFTFYARTSLPGETVRFDFGGRAQAETGNPFRDAVGTDTGDLFDDVYGEHVALVRLRPFLQAHRLQAVAPGDRLPAPDERLFDWSGQWDTREAFYEAFGRRFGGRVLDLMLARGWKFVEVVPESQDAGAVARTYTAQGDETPQAIAKRYDAFSRERWAGELKEANPQRDWTARVYAGDRIAIPEAWPQPFWSAATERGFLDTSGPTGELAAETADPFVELGAQRARQRIFGKGSL